MPFAGIDGERVTRALSTRPSESSGLHHAPMVAAAYERELDTIVVPLDGTTFSEHAIPLAMSLARRSGGLLKLIRAFTPSETAMLHPGSDAFDVIEGRLRADAGHYLDDVQRRITARVRDVSVVTHLVEASSIVKGLTRISQAADLVVMATHGRGWFSRFLHGSVGREMLRGYRRPLIYVRGYNAPVDFSADPFPRHLTIALDGRKTSERALEAAGMIARVTGARSTLLHVEDSDHADEQFAHSSPEAYLHATRRAALKRFPGISTRVLRNSPGQPVRGILSFREDSDCDLVAVTSRTGPPAIGSVSEILIRKSKSPVLVVRA